MPNRRQSSLPGHIAKLYSTVAWQQRRAAQIRRHPRCATCLKEGRVTAATVADHIERATDYRSFMDGPLQSLCATHHQSKRQAESHGNDWKPKRGGCDESGWPLDPQHAWNQ